MADAKKAAVMGLVRATLACAVLFGLHLEPEQQAALVVLAEAALIAASVLRRTE
jgi:hypothetical protein